MLRILYILFALILPLSLISAQEAVDSNTVIYGWELSDDNITIKRTDIDTLLENFQQHNVVSKKYYSVTFNGTNGSSYLSNLFFERNEYDDLLFLNSYIDLLYTFDKTTYLNTRKPFSHIYYSQSYPKADREEQLRVIHSQNITSNLNVGFILDFLSDKAQYKYQNANNKGFKVFSSYKAKKYSLHTSFNLNRYLTGESGGVNDSSYLFGDWDRTKEIETNFTGVQGSGKLLYKPNVTNRIRYVDGMISQSLKLVTLGANKKDTLSDSKTLAQPVLSHVFLIRRASKMHENSDPLNNQWYDNVYSNNNFSYDSVAEFKITNKVQLEFKTLIRQKVLTGIYGSINHEFNKYTNFSQIDTSLFKNEFLNTIDTLEGAYNLGLPGYDSVLYINNEKKIHNVFITAGIYGRFWSNFETRFSGKLYLTGYKAGQTNLDAQIFTKINILKRPYQLLVKGELDNIVPSYQYSRYYSNNFIWENDFKNINKVSLSGKIAAPSNRFEIEGYYNLLSNYIYWTKDGPESYSNPVSISSLAVKKEFVFWKIHSINKFWFQVSENRSVIEVPAVVFFNSTYLDQTWLFRLTNGKLRTMLGVDITYNTAFDGYRYNPSVAQYYLPSDTYSVGNYPYIDVWLNVRLKRARFFMKYEHVNSSYDNLNHYYAVNAPSKLGVMKIGLSWTFYD